MVKTATSYAGSDAGFSDSTFHTKGESGWTPSESGFGSDYSDDLHPEGIKIFNNFGEYMLHIVNSGWFSTSILTVILLNTILLTLQTTPSFQRAYGWYFSFIDNLFLGIYLFELILKLWSFGGKFFNSGWNNFDLFIVITSFLDWMKEIALSFSSLDPKIFRLLRVFRAVRALRALRVLRTISFLKSLQIIVQTLLRSIPAMSNVVMLLLLVMYIFALIGRNMYGEVDPGRFGGLDVAMFSLFQLLTLDDWYTFVDDNGAEAPTIAMFCILFIIIETFIFINLFIAVIVSNLEQNQSNLSKAKGNNEENEDEDGTGAAEEYLKNKLNEYSDNIVKGECVRDIDYFYDRSDLPSSKQIDKHLLESFLLSLPALDNNAERYSRQQKVLDKLVDLEIDNRYEEAVAEFQSDQNDKK